MSAEAAFYNNFDVWKYFFPTEKKLIRILRIFISFVLFWQKCAYHGGERARRAELFIFLVHLLVFESDTATSKGIAIITL